MPPRGLGRGRGRGRGQEGRGEPAARGGRGRGRGRGRGGQAQAPVIREDDSGDEDELARLAERDQANGIVFPADEEDDEDEEDIPPPPPELYTGLPREVLGDEQRRINRPFNRGGFAEERKLNRFLNYSPGKLALHFGKGLFDVIRDCSNVVPEANFTMADMYAYRAFLCFTTLVPLTSMEDYWNPPSCLSWREEMHTLANVLPRHRFYHIRKYMKMYRPEDLPQPGQPENRGWKVQRASDVVHEAFKTAIDCPGEFISVDEEMARASAHKNPIYTSLGKAKPEEGFQFWIAVDYDTKCIIGFVPNFKQITKENSVGYVGGYVGKILYTLFGKLNLPGHWYRMILDNFYGRLEIVQHCLENYNLCLGGTMQRRHTTTLVYFGAGKKPRPTIANPKGTLKIAQVTGQPIYVYGYMDSSACYFIDCAFGPGWRSEISRKNVLGDPVLFDVPQFIALYNKKMGGVDVVDQIRKMFGIDLAHRTFKWTVRFEEVLWSLCLTEAYNVHRSVNKNRPERLLSHTEFKWQVFKDLMTDHIVVRAPEAPLVDRHELSRFEPGSNGDNTQRRKAFDCRACPRTIQDERGHIRRNNRETSFYCNRCRVCYHPECFIKYQTENSLDFKHPKQIQEI